MVEDVAWGSRAVSRQLCTCVSRQLFDDRTFRRNDNGSVAVIFALTVFIVVAMVGGAVDFGRAYALKAKLQAAVDASALAAASAYVNDPNHDVNAAITHAQQFYRASMSDVTGAAMSGRLATRTQTVTMTGTVTLKTPFLSLVGIDDIALEAFAEATTANASSAEGSSNDVEISLMLDVTSSMLEPAGDGKTKLEALKSSAKMFVDVLIPDAGEPKARIALAPFANYVNVGEHLIAMVTAAPASKVVASDACGPASNGTLPSCEIYRSPCVSERTGSDAFTDADPGANRYFRARYFIDRPTAQGCGIGPTASIMPLTTDKAALKARIDSMVGSGITAGHLGTAWAWYLLSPNWRTVFTRASAPRPYNTKALRKIAVLMTDGEFNYEYAAEEQGTSISQAKRLCAEMKTASRGIEIFTVGFKLDTKEAIDTLNACATDASYAFLAQDAAQLEAVFKDIAYRTVPLHLAR